MIRGLLTALAVLASGGALAQDYPTKPIKIVVPFAAGSGTDNVARLIGNEIAQKTGQAVIVENKPGADGQIAARAAAAGAPDGYTLFITTQTTQASNPFVYKSLPYDPAKSFAPIALILRSPQMVIVRKDLPVNSIPELIAMAKKEPGKLKFGSGNGSARGGGELFKMMSGTDITHIGYKSQPQVVNDVMGGFIDLTFSDFTAGSPAVDSGKGKLIAVTAKARVARFPDVPTVAETVPGYEMSAWVAAYAPAGTPRPIIDKLNGLVHEALKIDFFQTQSRENGTTLLPGTPEDLAAYQKAESEKWAEIVRISGMAEP